VLLGKKLSRRCFYSKNRREARIITTAVRRFAGTWISLFGGRERAQILAPAGACGARKVAAQQLAEAKETNRQLGQSGHERGAPDDRTEA